LGKVLVSTTKLRFYFNGKALYGANREQNFLTLLPLPLRSECRIEKKKGGVVITVRMSRNGDNSH
jgi:hypothetical protein